MRFAIAVLALFTTLAAAASAQTATATIDEAAQALTADPVYVDPEAEAALTEAQADDLRGRIGTRTTGPVFIAVLPGSAMDEAGGSADDVLVALRRTVGRTGTYIVVAGTSLRADSNVLDVRGIADRAVREHGGEGLPAILDAMLADIGRERLLGPGSRDGSGGAPGGGAPETGAPDAAGDGGDALLLLGVLAVGGGGFALVRRNRRRREEAADLDHVKDQVRDELVELGEGIRALDIDVEMPGVHSEARADYERAVSAYDQANQAWNTARSVRDLEPVGAALEEGRWALQSARARLEGRVPPERTPPCFFDPRHGPSSREVEWAPPGGTPRPVPACEADAQSVDRGIDPGFREVEAGGRMVPYWGAGPAYSPFYGSGMFGGFGGLGLAGGLLGGLMLGELLDGTDIAHAGDFGGYGDGGFGGGDFGGGDFGGGDFGGGDFGGGDF